MSTFPLATLAPTITAAGISAPSFSDILNSLIATEKSIYGSDILLTPDTQDYQALAVRALAYYDLNQAFIAIYNGFAPVFAQGANLSSLVKINGLVRQTASNSTATVTIVGVAGTVISNGIVQDGNRNLWNLPPVVIVPGGGSIDVTATAQVLGAIAAGPNTITQIYTPTLGWQTVTNTLSAVPGAPIESDATLRRRQSISTGLPAQTPLQAILAAVANVSGVTQSAIYENPTSATDSNGIPSHSISVIVLGGDITQVARAIEQKKSPGTGTYGSTTVLVQDPAGVPVPIHFYQLAQVTVFVSVTIKALAGYVSSTGTLLIASIVNFINSIAIGEKVYYNWLLSIAGLITNPLGETFVVTDMRIGTAPSPTGTVDLAIAFNAKAISITADVNLTTT